MTPETALNTIVSVLIAQFVGGVGTVLVAYIKIRDRLTTIETKLDPVWREFERRRAPRG